MKFAAAYEESRDAVWGYLVYMTRDTALAEDLSQEVFSSYAKKKRPVLLLCKRNRRGMIIMALLLAGTCAVPFAVRGLYRVHSDLIVSSLWKESPQTVCVWFGKEQDSGQRRGLLNEDLPKEQKQELLKFCKNLTIISDESERKQLEEWYRETPSAFSDETYISIKYDEKYGHSYFFNLHIYEDKVFLWRGNGKQPVQYVTFFEDNGLISWLEGLQGDE